MMRTLQLCMGIQLAVLPGLHVEKLPVPLALVPDNLMEILRCGEEDLLVSWSTWFS
jgi:hypothetical protein